MTIAWSCYDDLHPDRVTIAAAASAARGLRWAPAVALGAFSGEGALGVDAAGNTLLVYSLDPATTVTRVRPPGGAFGVPLTLPAGPPRLKQSGGRLVQAGRRLTLLQSASGPATVLRDWTP